MTVYVESNFVCEIALGQEQSEFADAILQMAERREISLALPVYSLSEPFAAIRGRSSRSQNLVQDLRGLVRDRGRSRPHLEDVDTIRTAIEALERIEQRELVRLLDTVNRLRRTVIALPIGAETFGEAMAIMHRIGLSHQDAVVYASILGHIRTNPESGPHMFANRNWRDFEVASVVGELETYNCELLRGFDAATVRLESGIQR